MVDLSEANSWLTTHLQTLDLGEEAEGYLYGRGAREETIQTLGLREWSPSEDRSPMPAFRKKYGDRGEKLQGFIVAPFYGPSGVLLGIEARSRFEKRIEEIRLPEAAWNPVLLNAPQAAVRMWAGGSVWVTEGLFDLLALSWVIPQTDAVVATMKAGLAKTHVEFLARFCQNTVYMVYDNDDAGRRATNGFFDSATRKKRPGAMELLGAAGLRAIDYRYRGKDPGEVWRAGGARALRQAFQPYGDDPR